MASIQVTNPTIEDLVKTPVFEVIPADVYGPIIAKAPFVTVPGAFNVRDLAQPNATPPVRGGFLFRSGLLTKITDEGKLTLVRDLGVKTVFDLRSEKEREKLGAPKIEGVDMRWYAPAQEPQPYDLPNFAGEDGGITQLAEMYKDILVVHVPAYKAVFEHIRDRKDDPILFHCAGGKDRTGVLAALILQLAGCPSDVIARDYTLTRIGVEPERNTVVGDLLTEKVTSNPALMKGIGALCSVHYETMISFLNHLEKTFEGGAEGYIKTVLGFSEEDIKKIKANLTG